MPRTMKCPTCGKPTSWHDEPKGTFCSERCKMIDFGRWADEEYRVPIENASSIEHIETPNALDRSASDDRFTQN
ncbi:MAG: DNA gyrase inhibitor YacG [Pyrinomonadaceae bacterium]